MGTDFPFSKWSWAVDGKQLSDDDGGGGGGRSRKDNKNIIIKLSQYVSTNIQFKNP